jgi:aryl-phospho-beta-D-glucosidase BglC (GH1 family)
MHRVPASRLERLAVGANVCGWFRFPKSETEEHYTGYLDDAEIALLRGTGLRHVRLCVAPKIVMDEKTGAIREDIWAHIELAVRRLVTHDVAVIFDLHNEDRGKVERDLKRRVAFETFWAEAARRLSQTDPEFVVLEWLNEPIFDDIEDQWLAWQPRLHEIVRSAAPNHTVMATGPNWGGIDGLLKMEPLPDDNVVYSFHCYDPHCFTHQGATWSNPEVVKLKHIPYPSSPELVEPLLADLPVEAADYARTYGEERWDRTRLNTQFGRAIAWGKQHGVPLYCGEFGVYPKTSLPEHRANWFADFAAILSANRVGWGVWGWDENFGLDRRKRAGAVKLDYGVASALGLRV